MSEQKQVMALNPARKGNMGRINSLQPLAVYDQLIAQPWLKGLVEQIRGEKPMAGVDAANGKAAAKAREELKRQLPFRAIHYARFRNNHRSQGDADPESFLFQTTVDVDDKEYVEQALEKARELNCSDTIWKGKLLHLEYSARKKLHIDIRMPVGMTIEETQRAYCEASGIPYDKSCITPERIIFITDKDSEIYRSKEWYGVLPAEEISLRREAFLKRGLTIDGRGKQNFPQIPQMPQIHSFSHPDTGKSVKSVSSVGLKDDISAGNESFPQISQIPQIHSCANQNAEKSVSSVKSVGLKNNSSVGLEINSSEGSNVFKSNQNVQDNRFSGTNGDNAVYAGAAVQPAQPGNSHRVNDSHLGSAGASQDAGGVATPNASEKNLIAFELFKEAAGLKGMEIDTIGSRHSSLLAIMSAGASRVMSEDELMKVVAKKMPSYYEERDCHQLIHDFYAKYGDSSKPFSRDVMRINATAEKQAAVYQVNSLQLKVESSNLNVQSFQNVQGDEVHYPDPPAMPTKLPKLVEHLISNTPDVYKPAVAHAIFPPLATHLWNTRFRYIDNVEHEATLATVLLASTGAGKSCVQKPIEYIMEDIRKRDAENLKREKEWKDEVVRKGANKDKRKRPDNLIIQEIDADMTNPAFVMRTAEAQGHFLYTSLNEIDLFDALKGNGGQQFRIMCLAFDPSNKYGQTRVGSQSVTDRVTIRFNWNASSTIQKGQRYFSKVLTDGPISRINFCTIPEREIGEEMPVYGTYDEAYREGLKPYIENLCQASGLVECEEAFQLALKLKDEHAEFSRLSQDRTYENLSFRANVIGYLKACVLYVANGYRWEPEIEEFIRWSEQYDLYCKMKFFGDAIKRANGSDEKTSKRGPASLLQQLPDVFSFQQAEFLRSQLGMNRSGTVSMLRNWVNRNYVKKIPPQGAKGDVISIQLFSFEKLRNRKDGKVVDLLNS
jgi:hypothetical protein